MATSAVPVSPTPKSSGFQDEVSVATSIQDLFRFFQPARLRVSKNSPPVLNVDVTEGQMVWDRTLLRLYTASDNTLRYVQFT